ncbi:ABI3 protein, partial [Erithacus rubecula]|nr:ABI3 protein [Erithacus rubecula]
LQASDKRKALEETMALSTQSLASVTYQVSSVASAFLRLLDLQTAQLRQVEADVTCVAQMVAIHKEKVSRREIGALTVPRRVPSGPKVAAPPEPPVLEPYYRKPLNLGALDGVGHGVKVSGVPPGVWGRLLGISVTTLSSLTSLGVLAVPDDLELLPPPPAVPEFGDMALPPPPAVPEFGDMELPPPPAVPEFGDMALPPPPAVPEFGDLTPPPPPVAEDPPWAPQNYLEKVVALYPYTRQKDTELSLAPGALLFVTRRFSDGWCEGVTEHESGMGHQSGIFPGNFVEPV